MRFRLPVLIAVLLPVVALSQSPETYANLKWREVGPHRGGRSVAVSGVPGRPDEFYMGATGGGLWKTTNAGAAWTCVSDGFFKTGSVGGIGVSASNPDTVYVGMGETEIRGNITHGDGVYKTTDGGKTWANVGLRETQYIAKVRVHPTDPNTVYVAALGHVFGPNQERGVFKTTDGGLTWQRVLFVSYKAGAIDLAMDPNDAKTLYASTWEAWRTPYMLNSGGPGSRLFKSTDAGSTWTDLSTKPGMPSGILGKICIAVSGANSKRIYASVEAKDGGIFSSDDAGETWKRVNDDNEYRQRAWYFSRVYADPKKQDTLYVLNVGMFRSNNGGKSFSGVGTPHSDNHDLWIDPADPQRMIESNDGGAAVTTDGGRTWTDQNMVTGQFYHVVTDSTLPYRILGAQQDSSTVRMSSASAGANAGGGGRGGGRGRGGPPAAEFESTAGGESGYIAVKPNDPDLVFGGNYGGDLAMVNHRTGDRRAVDPWPDNPMGHGAIDCEMRFQWTYPILFSPNDPNTLYTCCQFVLKSTNLGQTWKRISPDLSRNDPKTLQSSGGPLTKDNTSVEYYGTVFTLAESPKRKSTLWAGSDDGLVHVTRNGGRSWDKVTPPGLPEWSRCSMIEASPNSESTAFLAANNYQNDDHAPYIFRTDDFGKTWTKIVSGIPGDVFVRVVREDPHKKDLLYAGTEAGVYVSFDGGANWKPLMSGLPVVPVHDLTIKNDDLVAATHGRGFWILDDISPLRQLAAGSQPTTLFAPKDAIRARGAGGATVDYYLAEKATECKIEWLDATGAVLATREGDHGVGLQRASATMSYPSFRNPPGVIMWGASPQPIPAPPGEYSVRMTVDGKVFTQKFKLVRDPNGEASDKDLRAQTELALKVSARAMEANNAIARIVAARKQIDDAVAAHKLGDADATKLRSRLTAVEEEVWQPRIKSGEDPLNFPIKLNNKIAGLLGTILTGNHRPTDQCYVVFEKLSRRLQVQLDELKLIETELGRIGK